MSDRQSRLRLDGVRLAADRAALDETVHAGEIVGLAGLDGHGQERLLEAMAGLALPASGRVLVAGPKGETTPVASFRQAARLGVAYLPRDRRATGIFPTLSILDNFAMASMDADTRFGLIGMGDRRRRYEDYKRRLGVVAADPTAPITALSGGNQQKVLLARWLARSPRVLLLNDPTRGVDIATRHALYGAFRDLVSEGMALVILSTEIEEILQLCNRVLVYRERQLAARLTGPQMSREAVLAAMFGRVA